MEQIVLIGPPGSGKTTIGKILAKEIGKTFIDTDEEIEKQSGRKISEIFLEDGEASFRKIEREVVLGFLGQDASVLALGGGSILDETVSERLMSHPGVTYLEVSISNAAPRVGFNRERPLLLGNPRQQWISLMEGRRERYESLAKFRFSTDNKKPKEVVSEILEAIK